MCTWLDKAVYNALSAVLILLVLCVIGIKLESSTFSQSSKIEQAPRY